MSEKMTTITEDREYKPSSPERPSRRFLVETGEYRWEVFVWRYEIKETGTPVYCSRADEGHSAYGLTVNETLNDIAAIMRAKFANDAKAMTLPLDSVRDYIDSYDAAKEDVKIAQRLAGKPFMSRLFGLWSA